MEALSSVLQLKRATSEWVIAVHQNNTNNYEDVFSILMEMQMNHNTDYAMADSFFQKICYDQIMTNASERIRSRTKVDLFPGPMAVQLCRKYLDQIKREQYWITEKSDGVRAMFLSLYEKDFPRWVVQEYVLERNTNTKILRKRTLGLQDSCALEVSFKYAVAHNHDKLKVKLMDNNDYDFNVKQLTLQEIQSTKILQLRRERGWTFSYLFDRKYEFHLCLEEFVFITDQSIARGRHLQQKQQQNPNKENVDHIERQIIKQRMVILDGEIVKLVNKDRYNYTIYDIVASTIEVMHANSKMPTQQIKSCTHKNMKDRMDAILQQVTEPHYFYYRKVAKCDPPRLQLIRKHFYKKEELQQVLDCITRSPNDPKQYIYKGYNLNDGLIFTPDSAALYPFTPGNNQNLLKWKWPDRLTADFMIIPSTASEDGNIRKFFFYFFHGNDHVYYRAVDIEEPMDQQVSEKLKTHTSKEGLIAECRFIPAHGWRIELIREDKRHANGFKVVANTLENMIENITVADLYRVCVEHEGAKCKDDKHYNEAVQREVERRLVSKNCVAHFRLYQYRNRDTGEKSISLQYLIQIPMETRMSVKNQVDWRHYVYLNECLYDESMDIDETAARHFEQVWANGGFASDNSGANQLFAQCIFVPHEGKWKVLNLNGLYDKCSGNHLLEVLEQIINVSDSVKKEFLKSSNKISQGNDASDSEDEFEKVTKEEDTLDNNDGVEPPFKKTKIGL